MQKVYHQIEHICSICNSGIYWFKSDKSKFDKLRPQSSDRAGLELTISGTHEKDQDYASWHLG